MMHSKYSPLRGLEFDTNLKLVTVGMFFLKAYKFARLQRSNFWAPNMIKYQITPHTPSLSPPGFRALLSPGHVFLFAVIDAISRTFSTRAPSIPWGIKSDTALTKKFPYKEAWPGHSNLVLSINQQNVNNNRLWLIYDDNG